MMLSSIFFHTAMLTHSIMQCIGDNADDVRLLGLDIDLMAEKIKRYEKNLSDVISISHRLDSIKESIEIKKDTYQWFDDNIYCLIMSSKENKSLVEPINALDIRKGIKYYPYRCNRFMNIAYELYDMYFLFSSRIIKERNDVLIRMNRDCILFSMQKKDDDMLLLCASNILVGNNKFKI